MGAGDPIIDAGNPGRGSGSGCAPDTTRDVRLLALALEERWPMTSEARAAAVRRLEAVVRDPQSKDRAFHRALQALTKLGRLNLTAIGVGLNARAQEDLEARVKVIEEKLSPGGGGSCRD